MVKKVSNWMLILLFTSLSFTFGFAQQNWNCGDDLTDNRDGQVYKTISINGVCWMAENLNFGTMIASNSPGGYQMTDNTVVEKYCWNNMEDYCDGTNGKEKKGAFYEWKEAMQYYTGQPSDPVQGVCPDGWHIPQKSEFDALITYLGGSSVAGDKMKISGSSGFEGMLTGYRCTMNGGFLNSPMGTEKIAYYWSTKQSDADNAYFYELNEMNSKFINGQYSPFYKSLGLSIRCVKDETSSIREKSGILEISNSYIDSESNELKIMYNTQYAKEMTFKVISISGQELIVHKIIPTTGNNIMVIDLSSLPKEVYILNVTNGIESHTDKIVIQ